MGNMSIYIEGLIELPVANGKIGASIYSDTNCHTYFTVEVKTITSVWVQWQELGLSVSVGKINGDFNAVNGETLTENTSYRVIIEGYQSPSDYKNQFLSSVGFTLKDSQNSSNPALDSVMVNRKSTTSMC
tara:strand:+ start:1066 stop:1455 length:390 start_codon:yes stop_codon:yes gene_type:complete